jgi:hypothetical protein
MSKSRHRRRGFSIIEISVTGVLLVLLSLLIGNAWIGIGRPLVETTFRSRIAQESVLAMTSLSRDFGGCLPDGPGALGSKLAYQLVGRTQPAGSELWLCFDGGATPNGTADWASPDVVVVYQLIDTDLVRIEQSTGAEFVVAKNVASFALEDIDGAVEITLVFDYHGISESYTVVAKDP